MLFILAFCFVAFGMAVELGAQETPAYTPAPAALENVEAWSDGLQACLAPTNESNRWEVFLWNAGDEALPLDGFTVACESGCLDPTSHVDLATQATEHWSDYTNVYGAGIAGMGAANPTTSAIGSLSVSAPMMVPPGPDFGVSLGRVWLAAPSEQVDLQLTYSSQGEILKSIPNLGVTSPFSCSVVPEPGAICLALFGVVSSLFFAGRRALEQERLRIWVR